MSVVADFYRTTIGKKVVVAVSGLLLFGFIVGHMLGNLKTFAGFDSEGVAALDAYAHHLRMLGADMLGEGNFLWLARFGLLGALILHVVTIVQLQALSKAARPVDYDKYTPKSSTAASRGMFYGGLIIFFFIIFHLLHFTTGHLHFDGFIHGQVYANVYSAFQHTWVVAVYLIAMFAVASHLYHGVWSMCQTLGVDNPDRNQTLRNAAKMAAVVVGIGFALVPVLTFIGWLPEPTMVAIAGH